MEIFLETFENMFLAFQLSEREVKFINIGNVLHHQME